jgi:hypothetical protein
LVKHGMNRTPEYGVWCAMKRRCLALDHESFAQYGGRGITVCDTWLKSFEAFFTDMGPRPGHTYTIERRDNNAGYSPENCYWATHKEQARNKRTNHLITLHGETKTLTGWCAIADIDCGTVHSRLIKGLSPEEALTRPVKHSKKHMNIS